LKQSILQKLKNNKKHTPRGAFTACTVRISLLETVTDAAKIAANLAEILLSTARSSFDEFQNARKCGQKLCRIVKSISWGDSRVNPNINGQMTVILN
jgi:UDP-N-acetylmuramoylalanine-D-glutamate ligase